MVSGIEMIGGTKLYIYEPINGRAISLFTVSIKFI